MKNVVFYGDLKDDIELTQSVLSFPFLLFNNIMIYFVPLAVFVGAISFAFSFSALAFLGGLVASTVIGIPKSISLTNKQKRFFLESQEMARTNLQELSYQLYRHDVSLSVDKLDQALIEEVTNIQTNKKNKTETTHIDRNIYFLDDYDTLQVLRETIISTKENGYIYESNNLALLEPDEIGQVEQGVEKVLVFKR